MKVLVLGGGLMGSVIAKDMAKNGYDVSVADNREIEIDSINTMCVDLSDETSRLSAMDGFDMVVCALPSHLGFGAVKDAISLGKHCVDLSYCTENVMQLDDLAKKNNVILIPDAGIAPGVSNLLVGIAINNGCKDITLYVGGFAADPDAPLGYAVSWSVDDLLDEFIRPARIIRDGEEVVVDALSGVESVEFGDVSMDAFYTDGLRTVLNYKQDLVKSNKLNIEEKTMRRAGHMEETKRLVKEGKFTDYVKENCTDLNDMLIMHIKTDLYDKTFKVFGDDEMSAMARSTALSCSAFAQLLADGIVCGSGVMPPEVLSTNDEFTALFFAKLLQNGVL